MSAASEIAKLISKDPEALAELVAALAPLLPSPTQGEDGWMSTKDAAGYLGITPNALHKLTGSRAVPFEQDAIGGKCWFKRSELDAWRRGETVSHLRVAS